MSASNIDIARQAQMTASSRAGLLSRAGDTGDESALEKDQRHRVTAHHPLAMELDVTLLVDEDVCGHDADEREQQVLRPEAKQRPRNGGVRQHQAPKFTPSARPPVLPQRLLRLRV